LTGWGEASNLVGIVSGLEERGVGFRSF